MDLEADEAGARGRRSAQRAARYALLTLMAALLVSGVWLSRFSRDESQWIYTTRYLVLFAGGEFGSEEWHSYWTRTQPPLARYVMGAALALGGYDLLRLNGPWDFAKEDGENAALGNMPTEGMLTLARLPMGLAGAASVLLLYLAGRGIGGGAAGLGAGLWLALNPRWRELMTRAEADGLLVLSMLAGLLLAMLLAREIARRETGPRPGRVALIAVAAGVALGLGASAKLTAAIGLIALPLALGATLAVRYSPRAVGHAMLATAAAWATAAALFVALNPALYRAPLDESLALFRHRQEEMEEQMAAYPSAALTGALDRVKGALERPLFTYSVGAGLSEGVGGADAREAGQALPFDALLAAVGLAAAGSAAVALLRRRPPAPPATEGGEERGRRIAGCVAIVWTAVHFILIAANLGLDWDRYTLPLGVFAALWAGVGIGWLAHELKKLLRRGRQTARA